jgi:hypothetical protein
MASPGLLERLPHRGTLRALARLDLPADENPRRPPVPASAEEDQAFTGDDGESYRARVSAVQHPVLTPLISREWPTQRPVIDRLSLAMMNWTAPVKMTPW